eukprot:253083-Hanusia_phi.AAC.3
MSTSCFIPVPFISSKQDVMVYLASWPSWFEEAPGGRKLRGGGRRLTRGVRSGLSRASSTDPDEGSSASHPPPRSPSSPSSCRHPLLALGGEAACPGGAVTWKQRARGREDYNAGEGEVEKALRETNVAPRPLSRILHEEQVVVRVVLVGIFDGEDGSIEPVVVEDWGGDGGGGNHAAIVGKADWENRAVKNPILCILPEGDENELPAHDGDLDMSERREEKRREGVVHQGEDIVVCIPAGHQTLPAPILSLGKSSKHHTSSLKS